MQEIKWILPDHQNFKQEQQLPSLKLWNAWTSHNWRLKSVVTKFNHAQPKNNSNISRKSFKNSSNQQKFGYCYAEFEFGDVPCVYSK